jgi:predicted nucleotidyltransferase
VAYAIKRAQCAKHDQKQDTMSTETDFQLTANQWDMLRALRPTGAPVGKLNRYVLDQLAELGLVALVDDAPTLTKTGRAVVLRGCPKLWDLAA